METVMHARLAFARNWPLWLIIGVMLAILYLPVAPVLLQSFRGDAAGEWTLRWYRELLQTAIILKALQTTALIAFIVGLLATALGLIAALSIRQLGIPRLILLAMLLPLFIPGVSMGLASALLFKLAGITPSITAIVIVQTLWALPFATLIILTVMAAFDPTYLEAAYVAGAGKWQAFRDIEFPLIAPGIYGAASFALTLSINETIRTSAVQGPWNTIPTYIWSTYKQVGLSPVLYALMGLIIMATIVLAFSYFILTGYRASRG